MRVVEGSGEGIAGYVEHACSCAWRMRYVVVGNMAGIVCLVCRNCEQCWVCRVSWEL